MSTGKPRIPLVPREQADQETVAVYDSVLKERGKIPNMFRTVAHRPEILRTLVAHWRAVLRSGTVPLKLKELVIVRTSQINGCEY
jgi:alkylhydroperoxidase family enzyme